MNLSTFAARFYPVCDININSKPQCVLHCGGCSIIFLNFVRIRICIPHINHAYMLCGNWLNDCILFIIDHVQEYFTRKEMSPVPQKGCKFYTYGLIVGRGLNCSKPYMKRDLPPRSSSKNRPA